MISFLTAREAISEYCAEYSAEQNTRHSAAASASDGVIQPQLALSRPGLKTYVWEIHGAQILIEVSDADEVRVNGKPVARATRRL